ncbi:ferrochelatase [Helicobacter canis]|nr:ferrochelatase [Helicobacter canis]
MEYKELAKQKGVKDYLLCPCMNDSPEFATMIYTLAKQRLDSSPT